MYFYVQCTSSAVSPERIKWGTLPCREMYSVPCIVGCLFVFVFVVKDGVDDCMKMDMVKVREGSLRECMGCMFMGRRTMARIVKVLRMPFTCRTFPRIRFLRGVEALRCEILA